MSEVQFNRSFAAENGDQNINFALFFIDFVDSTEEVGKGTFINFNRFSKREGGFVFGSFHRNELFDGFNFFFRNGGGFFANTDESGNSWGGANGKPRLVVDDHFDEHVTRENLFFNGFLLAFFDLDFFLSGDQNFKNFIFDIHGIKAVAKFVDDFEFVA